jgi:hypothetical protein
MQAVEERVTESDCKDEMEWADWWIIKSTMYRLFPDVYVSI